MTVLLGATLVGRWVVAPFFFPVEMGRLDLEGLAKYVMGWALGVFPVSGPFGRFSHFVLAVTSLRCSCTTLRFLLGTLELRWGAWLLFRLCDTLGKTSCVELPRPRPSLRYAILSFESW